MWPKVIHFNTVFFHILCFGVIEDMRSSIWRVVVEVYKLYRDSLGWEVSSMWYILPNLYESQSYVVFSVLWNHLVHSFQSLQNSFKVYSYSWETSGRLLTHKIISKILLTVVSKILISIQVFDTYSKTSERWSQGFTNPLICLTKKYFLQLRFSFTHVCFNFVFRVNSILIRSKKTHSTLTLLQVSSVL